MTGIQTFHLYEVALWDTSQNFHSTCSRLYVQCGVVSSLLTSHKAGSEESIVDFLLPWLFVALVVFLTGLGVLLERCGCQKTPTH